MRVRVRCGVRMRRWCGYGPYAAKINFMSMLSFSSVHHSGRRHIWVVSATRAERPYVNIYCSSSIIIFLLLGARRPRQSRDPPLQTPSPYDLPCSPCCSGRPHALTVAPLAPPAPLPIYTHPCSPSPHSPGDPRCIFSYVPWRATPRSTRDTFLISLTPSRQSLYWPPSYHFEVRVNLFEYMARPPRLGSSNCGPHATLPLGTIS